MYLKINKDGSVTYPYNPNELRRDYTNVSFPRTIPDDIIAEYGVLAVVATERPTVDDTQQVIEIAPMLVKGKWVQTYQIVEADNV